MLIDAAEVEKVLRDCLWSDDDTMPPREEMKVYEGIVNNYSFDPAKVEKHKEQITKWLQALPREFHAESGGGMSFLQACVDSTGQQWGEHINMEMLFTLGMATGQVKPLFPRAFWGVLPGGVPYFVIDVTGKFAATPEGDGDASKGP